MATEADLQRAVLKAMKLTEWWVVHFKGAMVHGRWMTPFQADGKGFFDLVAMRGPRLLFVELKGPNGIIEPDQKLWLAKAKQIPGAEVHVWRPNDRDLIAETLV